MSNETLIWPGSHGRHRSPSAVGPASRMARAVQNLGLLPKSQRFFAEPFELMLATSSMVSGILVLTGTTRPASLALQLSPVWVKLWAVMLCSGSATTLWARWRIAQWDIDASSDRGLVTALRFEVAAMTLLAFAVGVYAVAILLVGLSGLQAGLLIAGWTSALGQRAWIVSRHVAKFERTLPQPGAAPDG